MRDDDDFASGTPGDDAGEPDLWARLDAQDAQLSSLHAAVQQLLDDARDLDRRGSAWEIGEAKRRMLSAVANGDSRAFSEAFRTYEAMTGSRGPQQADAAPPQSGAGTTPEVQEWLNDNPWFNKDRALSREATAIEANLLEDNPYLTVVERLNAVSDEIVRRHPEKFGARDAEEDPAPTLENLPEDARAALVLIQRQDPKFKTETYLKNYYDKRKR
jgi:hypothetical protein